jgi:hypothetical protein
MSSDPPCAAAAALIAELGLEAHPEGGWYRRVYTSSVRSSPAAAAPPSPGGAAAWPHFASSSSPAGAAAERPAATAIHYLLTAGSVSRLHVLKSDELWFHHAGGALTVLERRGDGSVTATQLGGGPGVRAFHSVAAGTAFGAELPPGSGWALVSCVVVPGFDFADWRLVSRDEALAGLDPASAEAEALRRITL